MQNNLQLYFMSAHTHILPPAVILVEVWFRPVMERGVGDMLLIHSDIYFDIECAKLVLFVLFCPLPRSSPPDQTLLPGGAIVN